MYLAMSVRAVLTAVIGPEIHALVLHEPVDEHVVTPRTTPVHADLAALGQHNVDELRRNELGRFSRSSHSGGRTGFRRFFARRPAGGADHEPGALGQDQRKRRMRTKRV